MPPRTSAFVNPERRKTLADGDARSGEASASCACAVVELRCCCRSLVARRRGAVVEIKCRRCKRLLTLDLSDGRLGAPDD